MIWCRSSRKNRKKNRKNRKLYRIRNNRWKM